MRRAQIKNPISLRTRLFLILLAATSALLLSAVVWINHSTRAEVERVLDARLSEAARMVSSLISDRRVDVAQAAALAQPETFDTADGYSHQLSCQIWSLDGTLVGQSGHAPARPLAQETDGFSQNIVDGVEWRVYSVVNHDLGVRVMVGDSMEVRNRLVNGVIAGLLLPAAVILPLLAGLIWASVGRGLVPLDQMARALGGRPATDLSPLPATPVPREIRPVSIALNDLFRRLSEAREHERNFTAFAAHELKTPLAGLKTQAQIAAMAPDAATRQDALTRLIRGVDRTDRMVRQLLDMASVDSVPQDLNDEVETAALHDILAEVADNLAALARGRNVSIVLDGPDDTPGIHAPQFLVAAALRNLMENAIQASPDGGEVEVSWHQTGVDWCCTVSDRGPGIAAVDRNRVTDRFYRGAVGGLEGSGLGLSIVKTALDRIGGVLTLTPRPGGGETATVTLPHAALRTI
ncbi:histidine kinase [Pseudotabrizicola sediminis]|uniref:histidine kinase n=1 Tax=Pseudotabrizicola sediminis TaxID=2486418 RepID=A0ABY2KH82_9RHOB|nr:sensor histidine kinase [Pseudotabrizicola sediminis]TGD41646.1 histidine kinase [Pseudotabrizicola sediminis]